MGRTRLAAVVALMTLAAAAAPGEEAPAAGDAAALGPPADEAGLAPAAPEISGTVAETMSVGRYTYVELDTGEQRIWVAGPRSQVEVGDRVEIPDGIPMTNFYSKSLERRFDRLFFTSVILVEGQEASLPPQHPTPSRGPAEGAAAVDLSGIERAEGGKTIGEIYEGKAGLAGEEVSVRGRVVKSTSGVMGRNWLHLQDGTAGPQGESDLTVTTEAEAEVGNTLVVRGIVVLDRDFGYGYHYDLLVEASSVTVE